MSKAWTEETKGYSPAMDQARIKYRFQVAQAYEVAKSAQIAVFKLFGQHFARKLATRKEEIDKDFADKLRDLTTERSGNDVKLAPRIADMNLNSDFESLMSKEADRTTREKNLIRAHKEMMLMCERESMAEYAGHMNMVVEALLRLFDQWVLFDDLVDGGGVAEVRKTTKEMMKDRERAAKNPALSADRPFHEREWPSLRLVMEPLADLVKTMEKPHESRTHGERTRRSDDGEKGKGGGRDGRSRRTREGRSRTDRATVERPGEEMMPPVSSLETPIHRSVIIERNRAYASYQADLTKRLEDFGKYVEALDKESDDFSRHWKDLSVSLLTATRYVIEPNLMPTSVHKKK
jgi:hypothetical protein